MRLISLPIAVTCVLLSLACDGGTAPDAGIPVAQVLVSLQPTTIGIREAAQATVSLRDAAGGSVTGKSVTWSSSNPSVAIVTDGTVTGVSAGTTSITATADGVSGSATLAVVNTLPNVRIDNAYLVQVIQSYGAGIPLVAGGNPVLVRVFGRWDRSFPAGSPPPRVRVEMYREASLLAVDESPMTGWPTTSSQVIHEVIMPSMAVQAGLRFRVTFNPDSVVAEQSLADNVFPADGLTRAVDVRALQPLRLRFVPVLMPPITDGAIGEENLPDVLGPVRQVHPLSTIESTIGGPVTTTWRGELGDRGALSHVLAQVDLVRLLEQSTAYYVAVMGPGAGFSGVGYLGKDPTDFGPGTHVSGIRSIIFAPLSHELGHNMGRLHAPCANPADDLDLNYPYAGGLTNATGADLYTWSLNGTFPAEKPPSMFDLMSYCGPRWISDYTFMALLNWRLAEDAALAAMRDVQAENCLIVWGAVESDSIRLEPSFVARTRPALPPRSGPYELKGTDWRGAPLFSLSFDPSQVDHGDERHFMFAIPLSDAERSAVTRLTVAGEGSFQTRVRGDNLLRLTDGQTPSHLRFARTPTGRATIEWDATDVPLIIVRERGSGRVLGIGMSGRLTVATSSDQVDVLLSNGIGSVVRSLTAR